VRLALVVLVLAGATLGLGEAPARATNECDGLMICVPIAGPWVVVPTARTVPRLQAEYQLSCPRRYIVGGLDVQLSNRAIDVKFLGKTGSPVNPGITTERAAVFLATYTGASARVASFRPHIGCVPASGGGGGPVPYLSPSALAVAAAAPVTRRVSELRLRAGATQTATRTCARGERLLDSWHAVGFYTARAPSAQLVSSVLAKRSTGSARVRVSVRSGPAIGGVRAVVQVGAVCGGEG
jgi:hypothetical protein